MNYYLNRTGAIARQVARISAYLALRLVAAVGYWGFLTVGVLAMIKMVMLWLSIGGDLNRLGEMAPAFALIGVASLLGALEDFAWPIAMRLKMRDGQ